MNNYSIPYIDQMKHSPVYNYVVPGLTSWLIGEPSKHGCVRMFECERAQQENVVPHSHKFDFQCLVLKGTVLNRLWTSCDENEGDEYAEITMEVGDKLGTYAEIRESRGFWRYHDFLYSTGEWYSMKSNEVHSIFFGQGSKVLFFEGPRVDNNFLALEPVVNGKVIKTFEVKNWMFETSKIERV